MASLYALSAAACVSTLSGAGEGNRSAVAPINARSISLARGESDLASAIACAPASFCSFAPGAL